MTLVKICGVTNSALASFAAQEGAAFIGLVFDKSSHRCVTLTEAKKIALTSTRFGATPVGVFTTQDAQEIKKITKDVGLQMVQLHGKNARAAYTVLSNDLTCLYVLHVEADGKLQKEDIHFLDPNKDFLVYDGIVPGSGKVFSWENFHPIPAFPFFLAGGLTPNNVKFAIEMKHPMAVDVSSGVEDPKTKQKDKKLIQLFIQRVRTTK